MIALSSSLNRIQTLQSGSRRRSSGSRCFFCLATRIETKRLTAKSESSADLLIWAHFDTCFGFRLLDSYSKVLIKGQSLNPGVRVLDSDFALY